MSWTLDIAYRERSDSLVDLAFASKHFPTRRPGPWRVSFVLASTIAGDKTAGDLFDRLGTMDPADRRQLLDRLREQVGLESTEHAASPSESTS